MITIKPPITNFTPFHVTRVVLLRQQRELNWIQQRENKPKIIKLDGTGVVKEKKPKKKQITLPANFASLPPGVQQIILQQLGLSK
jgi:hypothetical protein